MIIRVTTDNKVSVHPYPTGKFHEKQSFLTGLIGNGCCLVEHVTPRKLYTHWGMPLVKVSILVDEEGLLKPNKTNRLGEYLCDAPIMGNILLSEKRTKTSAVLTMNCFRLCRTASRNFLHKERPLPDNQGPIHQMVY